MDRQDKEIIFVRIKRVVEDYDFKVYLERHGALYIENLEFKLKEELLQRIKKEILE